MRIEVCFRDPSLDGRARRLTQALRAGLGLPVTRTVWVDVYVIAGVAGLEEALAVEVFTDRVAQRAALQPEAQGFAWAPQAALGVEVAYKPGVTNPEGLTAAEALHYALKRPLEAGAQVQSARLTLFETERPLSPEEQSRLTAYLHNPLIQQALALSADEARRGARFPAAYPGVKSGPVPAVAEIPLAGLDDAALDRLSTERLLALTTAEMRAVQAYYGRPEVQAERRARGLSPNPTDVELELIAQTWSEHCKHKIFAATVEYEDTTTGETRQIKSLYKTYIKQTTKDLEAQRPGLRSVFTDNAGVVAFDEDTLVCFKVETHNSPSALDPYGGAITGIVGVNRDILGTGIGAKPVFNTNVLCFGDPWTPADQIPSGLLHPRRVLKGVHQGIVDGGNHSGIPTVAGGFQFDDSYRGKPLVFCGTGGIIPATVNGKPGHEKIIEPGDLAVMLGGRIGKDGIHGATFSSLALDETSPTSAVQIGDPIIQRKMTDFLLEARDQGLYKALTDNGAGGLSSSLGEMATTPGGVRIDLDKCPLKYPGLAPWEILVSESQERMSLAVDPARWAEFHALAERFEVEASVVGEFTGDGLITATYAGRPVAQLSLDFVHDGNPGLVIPARWEPPKRFERPLPGDLDLAGALEAVLADPTVASKEALVRQYDHEVQGRSVVKPFCGEQADGPSDGAVLKLKPGSWKGLTVTHGLCPRYSDVDARAMALCAVDEAYRAHIALGGDPDEAYVLDNFCWPDPVLSAKTPDGPYKMAQLVRTNEGLREACLAYGLPLISGKDSMKNDAVMNGRKVSIRPTLLISLMGMIPDVRQALTTDFLAPGHVIYLAGRSQAALAGTVLEKVMQTLYSGVPSPDLSANKDLYRTLAGTFRRGLVSTSHDLADGGLAVALAESCLGGRLGAELEAGDAEGLSLGTWLFNEAPGRILLAVAPEKTAAFESALAGRPLRRLGTVSAEPVLRLHHNGRAVLEAPLDRLSRAFQKLNQEWPTW